MLSLGTLRLNLSERAESARNAHVARDSEDTPREGTPYSRAMLDFAQSLIFSQN